MSSKSEECPRKLSHIVKVWFIIKYQGQLKNKNDNSRIELSPELEGETLRIGSELIVFLESVLLQTIGFDLQVELPHLHVIQAMMSIAPDYNKLAQMAYWIATDILHMTNWCVRYSVRTIACVCVKISCAYAKHDVSLNDLLYIILHVQDSTGICGHVVQGN